MDAKRYIDQLPPTKYLSIEELKSFTFQIIGALAFCHCRRIMHRDLKPQNLLIDGKGVIKLADFGLARAFGVPVRAYTHEVVTLWYRPPEVLLGTTRYSTALDMWSTATVVYELATKKPLFCGDSEIDQLYRIFAVLGTPTKEDWPGVENLNDYNESFPTWQRKGVKQRMKEHSPMHNMSNAGIKLLEEMLIYDPLKRCTSKAAMQHEFFNDIDPQNFPLSKYPAVPMTLDREHELQQAVDNRRNDPLKEINIFRDQSKNLKKH